MSLQGVSGIAVASTAAGGILIWSGVKGANVTSSLKSLISGQQPSGTETTALTSPTSSVAGAVNAAGNAAAPAGIIPGGGTTASNQATARLLAAPYGWSTGANWTDLVLLWNRESGWSNTARNSSSGAYGIAQ